MREREQHYTTHILLTRYFFVLISAFFEWRQSSPLYEAFTRALGRMPAMSNVFLLQTGDKEISTSSVIFIFILSQRKHLQKISSI